MRSTTSDTAAAGSAWPATRILTGTSLSGLPEALDADWISAALGTAVCGDEGVTAVEVERVGSDRGHLGSSFGVSLTYGDRPAGAPSRVVVKLPALTEASRGVASRGALYEREYRFFAELASRTDAGAPHCFAAAYDADSDAFALVLEDVTGRTAVDQIAGCPVDLAEASLRQLGRAHASWWGQEELRTIPWLTTFSAPHRVANLSGILAKGWPLLCAELGDRLGPRADEVGVAVLDMLPGAMGDLDRIPQTLLHGDPRLDNLMFDAGEMRVPVVLLDWQNVSRGPAVADVSYFLTQNLTADDFREHRHQLLAAYHQELVAGGVTAYPLDELTASLPLAMPVTFAVAASLFVVGDVTEARTRELAATMATRALSAARVTGLLDSLGVG